MRDRNKTKGQLIEELTDLRQRIAELEVVDTARVQAEEALRESEERYRAVIQAQTALIYRYLPDGTITFANDAYCQFYGKPLDEIVGTDQFDMIPAEAQNTVRKHIASLNAENPVATNENRNTNIHGESRWFHWTDQVILNADGDIVEYQAVGRDITERVQAEEALRKERNFAESLVNTAQTIILVLDVEGRIVRFNPYVEALSGYSLAEVQGRDWFSTFLPTQDYSMVRDLFQKTVDDIRTSGNVNSIVTKDGRERQIEWYNKTLKDAVGNVVGVLAVGQDITARVQAEEALRESEGRFRAIFETAQDSIFIKDRTLKYTQVNPAMERLFELPAPKLIGLTDGDLFPEEAAAHVREVDSRVLGGEIIKEEYTKPVKEIPHTFHVIKVPMCDSSGEIIGLCGTARDITERVRAAEALRESHAKLNRLNSMLRLMCDNLPESIWTKDLQGRFMFVNKSCCEDLLSARDVYEPVGKTDIFFAEREKQSHPENPNYHTFGETCTDSDKVVLEIKKVIKKDESGNIKGRFVILDVIKSPFWDENGELIGTVGCARDVTRERGLENERERLLAQNQTQAHLMRGIMDTVPEGVLLLDANGCIALANPAAGRALAVLVAREDLSTRKPLTRLGDRFLAELLTSPLTKGLWHEVKADGRTFEVIARPMANDTEPENWVLVIRDVTQEREIEWRTQQQERLVALGQLAAGVAHDFNNIMTVILLYTQMSLNAPDLPAKIRQRLETVSGQAYRATDLVQQILDFSRRAVLERRPMDLTPFLKEVINLLERTVPESVEIRLTYGTDEYTVHADPTRMQQAIMNLAVNARDAMPEGGELRIELARVQVESHKKPPLPEMETGEWVRIAVTDNGAGIPPEVLAHIFEPFFTTKEVGQGTGLGLAQVAGIVAQHEGHIDVTTKMGEGTTFTIYLPALLGQQSEAPVLETQVVARGQGEVLLLVEDNAALREALADSLELLDYRVLQAANGREALAIMEQHADEIALVLTDVVMPEMGGQALFQALRRRDLTLPVVMLTGHPMENELENLKAQGLAGWMLKPPDMEQLSQLLARALSKDAE